MRCITSPAAQHSAPDHKHPMPGPRSCVVRAPASGTVHSSSSRQARRGLFLQSLLERTAAHTFGTWTHLSWRRASVGTRAARCGVCACMARLWCVSAPARIPFAPTRLRDSSWFSGHGWIGWLDQALVPAALAGSVGAPRGASQSRWWRIVGGAPSETAEPRPNLSHPACYAPTRSRSHPLRLAPTCNAQDERISSEFRMR